MSAAVCMLPLLAGLSFFSQNPWQSVNVTQQHFLDHVYPYAKSLDRIDQEELQAMASSDVDEVNLFLSKNNFTVTLQPGDLGSIYIASILNVLFEWGFEGAKVSSLMSKNDGQEYPAVLVNEQKFFQVFKVNNYHNRGIFKLPAKRPGDYLYLSYARQNDVKNKATDQSAVENAKKDRFALLQYITRISQQLKNGECEMIEHVVQTLKFPMVNINEEQQHDWMLGMKNHGYFINQAIQHIKFQMDEKGAAVSSGFASEFALCVMSDMVIDEPFFLWIERNGIETPIFAAYIDESSWKRPVRD